MSSRREGWTSRIQRWRPWFASSRTRGSSSRRTKTGRFAIARRGRTRRFQGRLLKDVVERVFRGSREQLPGAADGGAAAVEKGARRCCWSRSCEKGARNHERAWRDLVGRGGAVLWRLCWCSGPALVRVHQATRPVEWPAAAALATLDGGVALMVVLAGSPWPRWWELRAPELSHAEARLARPAPSPEPPPAIETEPTTNSSEPIRRAAPTPSSGGVEFAAFVQAFAQAIRRPADGGGRSLGLDGSGSRWRTWLAWERRSRVCCWASGALTW